MPRRPTPEHLDAWRTFLRAHAQLTTTLHRELEDELDLPLAWYDVLLNLAEASGQRLRMHDLAQAILLSRSGLTRLLDRMVAAGLVTREVCEGDRRGVMACLTPDGRATLRRAAPVHLRGIEEHFGSHLSADEARALTAVLEKLVD
jgi:DNA-binding MarR family transcriptional regulator